jgi:excisionase family DNA binding protein
MTTTESKLLYDRKTAAVALSISVRSLDYLISGGQLKTRRIGRKVLIHRSELKRFAQGDHFFINGKQ